MESQSSWDLSNVNKHATASFPTQFLALPSVDTFTFVETQPIQTSSWESRDQPIKPLAMMINVGYYDDGPAGSKPKVYAFVHGEKSNQVGFIYQPLSSPGPVRLHESSLYHVEFEEPMCDMGESARSARTVLRRARAAILYYFLAAGHLQQLQPYNHFWNDLKAVGASIIKSTKQPEPAVEALSLMDDQSQTSTASTPPSKPLDMRKPFHKRKRENNEHQHPRTLAHSTLSCHTCGPLCTSPCVPQPNLQAQAAQSNDSTSDLAIVKQKPSTQEFIHAPKPPADREQTIERLKLALQNARSENAQLRQQIEALTTNRTQPQELQTPSDPEKAHLQRKVGTMAAQIEQLQRRHNFETNAYLGLEQKFRDTEARLIATETEVAMAKRTTENLEREVANAKSTAKKMEKRARDAEEREVTIRAAIANNVANMAKRAAAILEDANTITKQLTETPSSKTS